MGWYKVLREAYEICEGEMVTVYRGESAYNKNGHYWSMDREFARNFTHSGLDREIRERVIDWNRIMSTSPIPFAGDEDAIANRIHQCMNSGYIGFLVDEGYGQPRSVYLL
jgi:hypothetical protein